MAANPNRIVGTGFLKCLDEFDQCALFIIAEGRLLGKVTRAKVVTAIYDIVRTFA
jgi:hypothetical protein